MMNPTMFTFERDASSDFDNGIYCKMVIRVEETDVEVYYTLTDDNGLHRYKANYSAMNFNGSFIPQFAEMFAAYVYADENVTTDGWLCVRSLELQLDTMF